MLRTRSIHGVLLTLSLLIIAAAAHAQSGTTPIGSVWDRYYEALALRGDIERPYMTIRQLSRNAWEIPESLEHPWQDHRGPQGSTARSGAWSARSLGVESYSSYNSRYASGGNDGAMWQGRGFNTRLQGGVHGNYEQGDHRLGVTLYPVFWVAENREFELVDPDDITGTNVLFGDPVYGYYSRTVDLPQRHGPDPIYEVGWGESEVRYDYGPLSAGFGNQALWLGPGRQNSLILSNNAGGFPKVDLGLRKTEVSILERNLGTLEAIAFWGRLTPSDYFDTTNYDDHNLYTGVAIGYSLPFWPEFTLGFNKVAITQWSDIDANALIQHFRTEIRGYRGDGGQQASLSGDFFSPATGTNIYVEWGRYDFSRGKHWIHVPGWSSVYSIGGRQVFDLGPRRFALLSVEHTNLLKSRAQMLGPSDRWNSAGFYRQHNVGTGFTHRGQILGGAIGPGGHSQYVSLAYYGRQGFIDVFVQRYARNKDVLYFTGQSEEKDGTLFMLGPESDARQRVFAEMRFGIGGYLHAGAFGLGSRVTVHDTRNFNYQAGEDTWNTRVELTVNYKL